MKFRQIRATESGLRAKMIVGFGPLRRPRPAGKVMMDPLKSQQERGAGLHMNGPITTESPSESARRVETTAAEPTPKLVDHAMAERVVAQIGGAVGGMLYDAMSSRSLAILNPAATPPEGAVLHPPTTRTQGPRSWLLIQLLTEVRLAIRMYFDPRYRISRTAQFLLPLILGLFFVNYFFFGLWFAIPVVSPIAERIVCVLLGMCLYRILVRELNRYRDVLDYLAKYSTR